MFIDNNDGGSNRERNMAFSVIDYEGVVPHDDDPMVDTLQIFNWMSKESSSTQVVGQISFITKLSKSWVWTKSNYNLSEDLWQALQASKYTYVGTST
jgi:hypothetical protein